MTVVVPAFHEAENLPHLIDQIAAVRQTHNLDLDVIVVDDDSRDGSVELIESRPERWVHIVVRRGVRGLSGAVLEGMRRARGEVVVCMDADLSHPPDALPEMVAKLTDGADFVVGSRYVAGGSTADDWGFLRWVNSRVATLLARPLTSLQDPMAGFFALRRSTLGRGREFNPVGYKIGLELLVKCGCERVVEVPIHFRNRRFGQSKLTFAQQLLYLQHLRRLYIFRYGLWTQLTQFLAVGAIGTVLNLAALTALLAVDVPIRAAVALAILIAMSVNFVLNRRFSFASARQGPWMRQFVGFMASCSVGALVNYSTTLFVMGRVSGIAPQVAALAGVVAGTVFNFVASRYLVFRAAHVRTRP